MVLSLLTAIGWWWAKLLWLVLESEESDKHIMVLPSLLGTLCIVEQWWHKLYTLNTWLKHWLSCPLPQCILNIFLHTSQKYWERQSDDFNYEQDVQGAMRIKWVYQYKRPTYYSCHYCINVMKQYTCITKVQVTLYCNMAYQSLFARYVWHHHKFIDNVLVVLCCFWLFEATMYEYTCLIHKDNTVDLIDCSLNNDHWLIGASW